MTFFVQNLNLKFVYKSTFWRCGFSTVNFTAEGRIFSCKFVNRQVYIQFQFNFLAYRPKKCTVEGRRFSCKSMGRQVYICLKINFSAFQPQILPCKVNIQLSYIWYIDKSAAETAFSVSNIENRTYFQNSFCRTKKSRIKSTGTDKKNKDLLTLFLLNKREN